MIHFSYFEQAIFAILVVASVSLFWRRFGKVWNNIRASKGDPDLSLQHLGGRVRDFIWEVVLQGKVIRQRPLPGLAHALVFWGFCAFALVSLNHFAEGVNAGLLNRYTWPGKFYFGFAAVFAIGVAIGIAGLAFRRFVVRPRWLGHVSYESGFIAFLIFLLMVTHLATFRVGWEESKAIWWAHTLALLIFLPLIPHTKHLHLVLSPVTVFLKRDQFSKIPPLVGDDDFGLDTGKDITQLDALQAYSCVECGRCTEHCPANLTGKVLNPKEIALGLRHYLNEFGPGNEAPLIGKHLTQEAVVSMHHLRVLRIPVSGGRRSTSP